MSQKLRPEITLNFQPAEGQNFETPETPGKIPIFPEGPDVIPRKISIIKLGNATGPAWDSRGREPNP